MTLPRLRQNIIALGFVQLGNYLVPLLTLPYLTRVLGAEAFGRVVFVQTVMAFFVLWVDFGFSWSATRHISEHRDDAQEISRTFSVTWLAQWVLLVFGALLLAVLVFCLPSMRKDADLYFWGFGLVIGQVLFPIWLLQGLENMKLVALLQLASKLLSLPLLFWLVRGADDGALTLVFLSSVSLLSGVFSIVWIVRQRMVWWCRPSRSELMAVFRAAGVLFLSRLSISLYTSLVPLVVGLVAGSTQLAYFNLADKVKTLVQSLLNPVSQALFPRMSLLFKTDRFAALALLRKSALGVSVLSALAGGAMFVGADVIARLLGGDGFGEAAQLLRWLAFVPLIVAFSNLLGVQIMLPLGLNRAFTLILSGASVLSVVLVFPMVQSAQALGAVQLVLLVELVVTLCMAAYLWKTQRAVDPAA
jgi:O-antigen/teichoic acid export membrane protein